MKSEVLFRGKSEDGEWLYGNIRRCVDKLAIDSPNTIGGFVIPETVGVFTGYRGLNYEHIFEGDILKTMTGRFLLVTDAGYGNWTFIDIPSDRICDWVNPEILSCCKIVDNIHDNPDFVKTYTTF